MEAAAFIISCDRDVLWVNKFDTRIFQMGAKGGLYPLRSFWQINRAGLIARCWNIRCMRKFWPLLQPGLNSSS